MVYDVLHACCPWTQCCSSLLNPIGCFFAQCLWVYFPNHMKSRGILFHHQQVLITSQEHDLIQAMESSWCNMKNSMQKTSHSRTGIHREKGKIVRRMRRAGWTESQNAHKKTRKIRSKVNWGQEEWKNFVKEERLLCPCLRRFKPRLKHDKNNFFQIKRIVSEDWGTGPSLFQEVSQALTAHSSLSPDRTSMPEPVILHTVLQKGSKSLLLPYFINIWTAFTIILLAQKKPKLFIHLLPSSRDERGLRNNCLYQHKG